MTDSADAVSQADQQQHEYHSRVREKLRLQLMDAARLLGQLYEATCEHMALAAHTRPGGMSMPLAHEKRCLGRALANNLVEAGLPVDLFDDLKDGQ